MSIRRAYSADDGLAAFLAATASDRLIQPAAQIVLTTGHCEMCVLL